MITRDASAFLDVARTLKPDFGPATARAAFLVAPDGFRLAEQSAADNRYMADAAAFDAARASQQHRELQRGDAGIDRGVDVRGVHVIRRGHISHVPLVHTEGEQGRRAGVVGVGIGCGVVSGAGRGKA